MSGKQQLGVLILHALIAVLAIIGATVLAAMKDLDASTVSVIYGTAIGLAGGSASAIASVGSALNGKSAIHSDAIRDAILAIAGHGFAQTIMSDVPAQPPPPPG